MLSEVATRIKDIPWFPAVVAHSEAILRDVPDSEKSPWYLKYAKEGNDAE